MSNKIKIIPNCIRIDLCIWRSQNVYITAFTAPRESFAVEFVVMKHFGWESSNVQPSCCLDVVVYTLNCVFWWHIPLEIEFKVVAQTMHSGVTHERCADFRHGKKKQKRGEFITPPRPTGRRSKNIKWLNPLDSNIGSVYQYLLQGHQVIKQKIARRSLQSYWADITWFFKCCLERSFISTTCKSIVFRCFVLNFTE